MPSFDTVSPADSLEFCPHTAHQDIFVCGTYKLLDQPAGASDAESTTTTTAAAAPQQRVGQCLSFRVAENATDEIAFEQIHAFDLPAILDMKWRPSTGAAPPVLAIADSEGSITLHAWREDAFARTHAVRCAPEDTLVLSLDWANRRAPEAAEHAALVASLSDGRVCVLRPGETGELRIADAWHAHDYEPWVAAWNYWDNNLIYSGGDDLKLKAWDVRQGFDTPAVVNKRFDAGVTSIQNHPHVEHLLAVGSYNNTVRLFDTRKLSAALAEVDVGGGAWRIKWHPSAARAHDLLVASMHDGFKVVRFAPGAGEDASAPGGGFAGEASIISRKDDHESMAYGADWSYAPPRTGGETIVGGCSFYDHKMSVWAC